MKSFNESNTVEHMILDAVENLGRTTAAEPMHDAPGWGASLGAEFKPSRWSYVPGLQVPRQPGDVMVELLLTRGLHEPVEQRSRHELAPSGTMDGTNEHRFVLELKPELCGRLDYRIRVYPRHELLTHPFELGLMLWV